MEPNRELTLDQIADLVGGRRIGRDDIKIAGVASLERAGSGDLSFLVSARYLPYFERSEAGAVLVTGELADLASGPPNRIVVSDPHRAAVKILVEMFREREPRWGIHPTAIVQRGARWDGRVALGPHSVLGEEAVLGADCVIQAGATVEAGATLGDGCRVGSQATVCSGTELGDRVRLKPGARVGTPGFAFVESRGEHSHVPHVGGCRVEDDVEIGANSTIDRGSIGDTVIGAGTKIDNLVQVAHNVRIGKRCIVMAQVGLAGSTVVEDDVMLAGQAGLAGHLTVGCGARVAAQAGVIGDVPAGSTVSGYPARPHREVLRQAAALRRLTRITPLLERMVEKGQ